MSISTAIEQQQAARPSIATVISQLKPEIQRALPRHLDADRIARLALTLVRKDRNLAQCTPESFAGSLLTAAALGLEPGVNGEAYLVPYRGECTLIIGYQGFAKLFYQSPLAKHIDAQAVHERDEFDYEYGLEPRLVHKPAMSDRGEIVAYYAVATLQTGASAFVVLSPEECKALRGGKVGTSGQIKDPMHWMERKTALRQLIKLLPKSAALDMAAHADERPGTELHAERIEDHDQRLAIEDGADPITGEVIDGGDA
jgi:recombination protein RecT